MASRQSAGCGYRDVASGCIFVKKSVTMRGNQGNRTRRGIQTCSFDLPRQMGGLGAMNATMCLDTNTVVARVIIATNVFVPTAELVAKNAGFVTVISINIYSKTSGTRHGPVLFVVASTMLGKKCQL